MSDYDARLVDLYDAENPDGPDHEFYRALADAIDATSILDLGCGTGILTVTFARPGRSVVGVDPSANMLAYAKNRPGGADVRWVLGDSGNIPEGPFDFVVMTGNVAQHIADSNWMRTLTDVRRAMREGGVLAFESRNPTARAWMAWTSQTPTRRATPHGTLREWSQAEEIVPGHVRLTAHNVFEDADDHVIETSLLVFREPREIQRLLAAASFRVEAVYGDWDRKPFTDEAALMIFEARAV